MGRWAFAHGFVCLSVNKSVVLKVAGLPEPPDNEPSDTMPFYFPKDMNLNRLIEYGYASNQIKYTDTIYTMDFPYKDF